MRLKHAIADNGERFSMSDLYYTGIGSREAPEWALELGCRVALHLAEKGYTLRSGGADGMDDAFEKGALLYEKGRGVLTREIYIPWYRFKKKERLDKQCRFVLGDHTVRWCGEMLMKTGVCPNWDKLRDPIKKLFSRNVYQVIGQFQKNQSTHVYSEFVVYWSKVDKKGRAMGGTRIAVNLAIALEVDTYNLNIPKEKEALFTRTGFVEQKKDMGRVRGHPPTRAVCSLLNIKNQATDTPCLARLNQTNAMPFSNSLSTHRYSESVS